MAEDAKLDHHKRHKAMLDASVFFFASLSSFYAAEGLHLSGIISALICGMLCNQFGARNLSMEAKEYARSFYVTLSEIADQCVALLSSRALASVFASRNSD